MIWQTDAFPIFPKYYLASGFSLRYREGRFKTRISHCQPFPFSTARACLWILCQNVFIKRPAQFFGAKSTDTEPGIYLSFTIYSLIHFREVQKKVFRSQSANKCQRHECCWQYLLDRAPPLSSERCAPVCSIGSQPKTSC